MEGHQDHLDQRVILLDQKAERATMAILAKWVYMVHLAQRVQRVIMEDHQGCLE